MFVIEGKHLGKTATRLNKPKMCRFSLQKNGEFGTQCKAYITSYQDHLTRPFTKVHENKKKKNEPKMLTHWLNGSSKNICFRCRIGNCCRFSVGVLTQVKQLEQDRAYNNFMTVVLFQFYLLFGRMNVFVVNMIKLTLFSKRKMCLPLTSQNRFGF